MKIRFFGRIIIIPPWLKYTFIGVLLVALSVAGFLITKQAKSGVVGTVTNPENGRSYVRETSQQTSVPLTFPPETPGPEMITVYIVGAIEKSDVYDIPAGSILNDLVKLAGGFSEGADKEAINLASALSNGMMVRIPFIGDKDKRWVVDEGTSGSSGHSISNGGLVNINTAGVAELCTLPGVGESTALKIISYRTENGAFADITDIMKVGGIKSARFNEIKNFITVG